VNDVTVSGVGHAGDILNLFATNTAEWGVTDVGRVLGISKSHAHRLLSSLNALGLLERQPRNRRYRLGWRWLSVAAVLMETNPLVTNAVPVIRELREQLDVTGRPAQRWEPHKLHLMRELRTAAIRLSANNPTG